MLRVSWLITIVSPYLVARFALRNLEVIKTLIKQNQAGDQMEMRVQRPLSKNVVQLGTLGHRRPVCRWSNCLGVGGGALLKLPGPGGGACGGGEQLPLPRLRLQAPRCPTDPGHTHFVSDQGAGLLAPPPPR